MRTYCSKWVFYTVVPLLIPIRFVCFTVLRWLVILIGHVSWLVCCIIETAHYCRACSWRLLVGYIICVYFTGFNHNVLLYLAVLRGHDIGIFDWTSVHTGITHVLFFYTVVLVGHSTLLFSWATGVSRWVIMYYSRGIF